MTSNAAPPEKEVTALLTFLTDPNEKTVLLAKDHLRRILRQRPSYKNLLQTCADPAVAAKAEIFLEETRLEEIHESFKKLAAQGPDFDLEQATILLAQFAYPALDSLTATSALDRLAEDVQKDRRIPDMTPAHDVMMIRRHLFDRVGFMGNERNYYDPDNSYIHQVLNRKMGIPISLSCVYLFVAKRLNIPAYGVGFPGHFLVGHKTPRGVIYIDPFHRGRILTRSDCIEMARQRGLRFQEAFLEPTPNSQVLTRMIVNLINVYADERPAHSSLGVPAPQPQRAAWLTQILGLFENA